MEMEPRAGFLGGQKISLEKIHFWGYTLWRRKLMRRRMRMKYIIDGLEILAAISLAWIAMQIVRFPKNRE